METYTYECIIIGDGAAGLSAALQLGRARRKTLVVGGGAQSNRHAAGIGGLLGNDRRPPAEFYATARGELAAYPSVRVQDSWVSGVSRTGEAGQFRLTLDGGPAEVATDRLILAMGVDYWIPAVEGLDERWGHSVFHCPFCHGWEHRGVPMGILDDGESGVHRALLLRMWSDDITLYTNGPSAASSAQRKQLGDAGIVLDERRLAAVAGPGTGLEAVIFDDGTTAACGGLMVPVEYRQRSSIARELGAAPANPDRPDGVLAVDLTQQTTVPNLFAAGDLCTEAPSVANAIAAGARAGAAAVRSIAMD